MTDYLLRTVLCSGLLIVFYRLFLERESMHQFKRWYLLAALSGAMLIPLIPIKSGVELASIPGTVMPTYVKPVTEIPAAAASTFLHEDAGLNISLVCMVIYGVVALTLLLRLICNVYRLHKLARRNHRDSFRKAQLIFLEGPAVPFSFLGNIYVSRDFDTVQSAAILEHEYAHVSQRHTWDLFLVEFVQAIFWINPFLFFFKRAIRLNHEFLADNQALATCSSPQTYQYALLHAVSHPLRPAPLTSSFHFSSTKQRIKMMTKRTSATTAWLRKILVVPVAILSTVLFTDRIAAQASQKQEKSQKPAIQAEGLTAKQMADYEETAKTMTKTLKGKNGKPYTVYSMNDNAKVKKMDALYRGMSERQRQQATKLSFIPMLPPAERRTPTKAQITEWLNDKKYGIWVDEHRIPNSKLKDYAPTDFHYYSVSKLERNAINYGKHYFQINLMTEPEFTKWRESHTPLASIPD